MHGQLWVHNFSKPPIIRLYVSVFKYILCLFRQMQGPFNLLPTPGGRLAACNEPLPPQYCFAVTIKWLFLISWVMKSIYKHGHIIGANVEHHWGEPPQVPNYSIIILTVLPGQILYHLASSNATWSDLPRVVSK